MNVNEMLEKAIHFDELKKLINEAPRLEKEKLALIESKKQEIERLKYTPGKKGFFKGLFTSNESAKNKLETMLSIDKETAAQITTLKEEIIELEIFVEKLKNTKPIELVDVGAISREIEEIHNQQYTSIVNLETEIVTAAKPLIELLEQRQQLMTDLEHVKGVISGVVNQEFYKLDKERDKYFDGGHSTPLPSFTPSRFTYSATDTSLPEFKEVGKALAVQLNKNIPHAHLG